MNQKKLSKLKKGMTFNMNLNRKIFNLFNFTYDMNAESEGDL